MLILKRNLVAPPYTKILSFATWLDLSNPLAINSHESKANAGHHAGDHLFWPGAKFGQHKRQNVLVMELKVPNQFRHLLPAIRV